MTIIHIFKRTRISLFIILIQYKIVQTCLYEDFNNYYALYFATHVTAAAEFTSRAPCVPASCSSQAVHPAYLPRTVHEPCTLRTCLAQFTSRAPCVPASSSSQAAHHSACLPRTVHKPHTTLRACLVHFTSRVPPCVPASRISPASHHPACLPLVVY